MGIEIVNLNQGEKVSTNPTVSDLVKPEFQFVQVPEPSMAVWLMTLPVGGMFFPWWNYQGKIDDELRALNQTWSITSPQGLFDCLFLTQFLKVLGGTLFVTFPGKIKTEGWSSLRETDQETFKRGQGCVYHLLGAYNGKFAASWVPFWEPQSIVRNPGLGSMWRLFSSHTGDERTRCLSFFSLSNQRLLPEVTNLLIEKDEQRSEKLSALVDWFGVYSSPLSLSMAASCVVYSRSKDLVSKFETLQKDFLSVFNQVQADLCKDLEPRSALRILTRLVAL